MAILVRIIVFFIKCFENNLFVLMNKVISIDFYFHSKTKNKVRLSFPTYIIGGKFIEHSFFCSGPGLRIECIEKYHDFSYSPSLNIGNNTRFNYNCHIGCCNKIVIGSNVLITDHSHGEPSFNNENIILAPEKRELYSKGPVYIGDNCWIGENACILPDVTIGNNSIIGANSVVTRNIPPYSIAVGSPAQVIKTIRND